MLTRTICLLCIKVAMIFCQIRSRQFEDFPSNWSEAEEIDFVVLRRGT